MKSTYRFYAIFTTLAFFLLITTPLYSSSIKEEKKHENFSLYDYNNKIHSLDDYTGKEGIVLMFISTQCPVSNAYNKRMAELYKDYDSEFVFLGINSNKHEDIAKIKEHAAENMLEFVILKDSNNVIADRFEASFTPEVYILDNDFSQIYHGRIDDSRREDDVEVKDLRNALNQIKNGNEVSVKETKAFGCTIKRVK